jgi:outer membrane protein assembly factor BamB
METPLVAGNHIYVATTEHQLVSLLRDTGQVRWITDLQEFSEGDDLYWSGPVMGGGRLILASSEGRILEFSPHDGSLLREYQAPGAVSIAPVIAGQSLYVLSDNGRLAAYR